MCVWCELLLCWFVLVGCGEIYEGGGVWFLFVCSGWCGGWYVCIYLFVFGGLVGGCVDDDVWWCVCGECVGLEGVLDVRWCGRFYW